MLRTRPLAVALPALLFLAAAARGQDLASADLSGAWRIKLKGTFEDTEFLPAKFKGKVVLHLAQQGNVLVGLSQEKFGACGLLDEPITGSKALEQFSLVQVAPVPDPNDCTTLGTVTLDVAGQLVDGAHADVTGDGVVDALFIQSGLAFTGTMKRISGMQTPDDPDGDGPAVPLALMGSGEPGSEGAHDLAVTKLKAPASNSTKGKDVVFQVKVQIQNRGQHAEVIEDALQLANLVTLEHSSSSTGGWVPSLDVVLDVPPPGAFPITLAPRRRLWVRYEVTFGGWSAPYLEAPAGPCIASDVTWTARVDHAALAGLPDDHPADDVAPRGVVAPYSFDAYPDGTLRERGAGAKKADGTFGDAVVTHFLDCVGGY